MKKELLSKLITGLLVIGTVGTAGAVPVQWSGGNDHWYELVTSGSAITWVDADAAAKASTFNGLPGYLVSLTSKAENNWVFYNIVKTIDAWTGGYQAIPGDNNSWHWTSGESWGFTAWVGGQPDNAGGGVQHTLYWNPTVNTPEWGDAPDTWSDKPSAFVVEYHQNIIPEPATLLLFGTGIVVLAGTTIKRKKQ